MTVQPLADLIRDVPDFPQPGVLFKDITPLLSSAHAFAEAIEALCLVSPGDVDIVAGLEARGFIFGAPVALALGAGFVPIRKPGKLPGRTVEESYALEYGTETLTAHADAIDPGARVLIVDDVLATGGTVAAAARLVSKLGGTLAGVTVLMELEFLNGRQRLLEQGILDVNSVLTFDTPESTTAPGRGRG
jgi:adenine phosphoribosyltransferase